MEQSLIYRASLSTAFGETFTFDTSLIRVAGFIYLEGVPTPEACALVREKWPGRVFICLSDEWEQALKRTYPDIHPLTRWQMCADNAQFSVSALEKFVSDAPKDVLITPFTADIFKKAPFGHGSNYTDFETFQKSGAGAAALHNGTIVSSASSYITYQNEVELDISTLPDFRRRGIGIACAAKMILECLQKGLTVHWDAQNPPSRLMAERLGFRLNAPYTTYTFFSEDKYM